MGGSQICILSQLMTYQGQQMANAKVNTQISNSNGEMEATIEGSYFGFGLYQSVLNLINQTLSPGTYSVQTQLSTEPRSGAMIQFDEKSLTVNPPLFIGQVIAYTLALALLLFSTLALPSVLAKKEGTGASRRRISRTRRKPRSLRRS